MQGVPRFYGFNVPGNCAITKIVQARTISEIKSKIWSVHFKVPAFNSLAKSNDFNF